MAGSQLSLICVQEWQNKLSQRGVAQMPWDPKPQQAPPPPQPVPSAPTNSVNGLPANPYASSYENQQHVANGQRIKSEPGHDHQYHGLPTGNYSQNNGQHVAVQGGAARAQQLVQQQFGNAAAPSLAAMQRGGLALPGQQQQKPQGLQLPQGSAAAAQQQQFQQQQQAAMARQQQQLQQQQAQPRIKVENDSPKLQQGGFQHPNYSQTDGADEEEDLAQWKAMLDERRSAHAESGSQSDSMMRDQVMSLSADLQSGLMVPLREQPSLRLKTKQKKRQQTALATPSTFAAATSIPQMDGGDEDEDEDEKPNLKDKDEDDPDAINSDLDDDDDDGQGDMGDDDDEGIDTILCTYDKVQRVKNKWKCTLKDGVMSVSGKEWVFHKGMGEFEW